MERVWKAVHVKGTQRTCEEFNMWPLERASFTEKCYVNKGMNMNYLVNLHLDIESDNC